MPGGRSGDYPSALGINVATRWVIQGDLRKPMDITGGCLCGAVRYRSTSLPLVTRRCWCRLCQYLGSGSNTINACFPSETFSIDGEIRDYCSIADSGNVMHREFCPRCGTHLTSRAEVRPNLVIVRAGTLDNPEIARPAATIWASMAPSWACFDGTIPRFEKQPPPTI